MEFIVAALVALGIITVITAYTLVSAGADGDNIIDNFDDDFSF